MRKCIVLITGILAQVFLISCFRGSHKEVVRKYYPNGGLRKEYEALKIDSKLIPNGYLKTYYENGNLEMEGQIRSGKREGLFKWYFKTGKIQTEASFHEGLISGMVKQFYEDGSTNAVIPYIKGKKDGIALYYYKNGNLDQKDYNKEGRTVYSVSYYENKHIKEECWDPVICTGQDSIKVGDSFKATVQLFNYDTTKRTEIWSTVLSKSEYLEHSNLNHPAPATFDEDNYTKNYKYKFKATKSGEYYYTAKIILNSPLGNTYMIPISHRFMVYN